MNRCGKYLLLFLFQAVAFFALALVCQLIRPISWLYGAFLWAVLPLAGALSAGFMVKRGVNAYLAWLLPPVMETAAGFIASMGYAPNAGAVLLCAGASLAGAATGDVLARAARKGRGRER